MKQGKFDSSEGLAIRPTDKDGKEINWHTLTEAPGAILAKGWRAKQSWYSPNVTKAQVVLSLRHIARLQAAIAEASGYELIISLRPKNGQTDPLKEKAIARLQSLELCLSTHPDNEPGSEFEDRIDDLQEVIGFLKQSNA